MPSTFPDDSNRISRRRVLAGASAIAAAGLAGCSGQLPGAGPAELNTETTVERDQDPRLLWRYPPREGDTEGIGYAAVEADRIIQQDDRPSVIHLIFNSTIGGIASSKPYKGYHPNWIRFRIWPPAMYEGHINHHVRVEPPGQWEGFSTYYDIRGNVRRTTVELRNVDTQGTIMIPAVFDPGTNPLPDRLHCSFTVQASRSGVLGKTIRVTGQSSLPIG